MGAQPNDFMFSFGRRPFHGILIHEKLNSIQDALEAAQLDWTVSRRPSYTVDHKGDYILNPSANVIVRDFDDKILGTVGPRYHPVQNHEAFSIVESLIEDDTVQPIAGGVLNNEAQPWVLFQLPEAFEAVPGDVIKQYLLISNSFDGTSALDVRLTPTRIVCCNMVAAAIRRGTRQISIRHTSRYEEKLKNAKSMMEESHKGFLMYQELVQHLVHTNINTQKWNDFALEIFPNPEPNSQGQVSERRIKNQEKKREFLTELFEYGTGQDIKGVAGTAWAAYNAVTEMTNYYLGNRAQSRRFESTLLKGGAGTGFNLNLKAEQYLTTAFA